MDRTREERKKTIYALMQDDMYVPMKIKELAAVLQVRKEEREELTSLLDELICEGKVQVTKRGRYSIGQKRHISGIYSATSHGFGFVTIEGESEDLFVSGKNSRSAMHGDTVLVEVIRSPKGRHREAKVIDILEHAVNTVVGTYERGRNHYGFVVPDDGRLKRDIFIPVERSMGAVDGHKVVVEITDHGDGRKSPEGRIIEILGHKNDPGVDILSIIKAYGLPLDFPERVLNQAGRVPDEISDADLKGREDLRDMMMVTIDGEDAKDLDDAVSVSFDGRDYELGVHIADVSNYVKEGSALDKEALKRGTSVYLADRVIPMLPHRLSNGICSLNEKQDRLALSCIMKVSSNGNIIDHRIVESVIKTNARMNYKDVNEILTLSHKAAPDDDDRKKLDDYRASYGELIPMFIMMKELADILRAKRKKRGSIDFDIPESEIILNDEGEPVEVKAYERNAATRLIEDFMLAANETVAQHFFWQELPFVYRIHENPEPDKIRSLGTFISNFGYGLKIKDEEIHPKELQKLLCRIEDTPEEALISRLTLRSMQRAKYSTECMGHFGLACQYYCHFTSPIRRYPDLQIHRIIKDSIRGRLNEDRIAHYESILTKVAKDSSLRERTADDAERETDRLKKAQYMAGKIGERFTGIISSVTNWGIYVELENTCEGLVHISKIDGDYYYYNESSYELIGETSGRRFTLGQKLDIIVNSVDLDLKTVDFLIADE